MSLPLLVTGAAGFIGSNWVRSCNQKNIPVISVDHLAHFQSRKLDGCVFGEQVDREDLFKWLDATKPKLGGIVHLGAVTNTLETDSEKLNHLNYQYSKQIWNYATRHNIPFVYASSAATYGDGEDGFADTEGQMPYLKPLNLYGMSKHLFDLWVLEKAEQGHCPPSWSGWKFFNVYGKGEDHKGRMASVVWHLHQQILNTGKATLFRSHRDGIEDGWQKRDFVCVEDVVEVLTFALNHPIQKGIFNLGTGQARTFLDLARAVFAALGKTEKIDFIDTPVAIREQYQYFTQAEMGKLRLQGYDRPFLSLEDGVRRTLESAQEVG